jgi:hypothetical protein
LPYYTPVQLIARKLAWLVSASSHCLASQHIKGNHNTVANLLSYAGDVGEKAHPLANDYPNDMILTEPQSCIPQLIPEGFVISPAAQQDFLLCNSGPANHQIVLDSKRSP